MLVFSVLSLSFYIFYFPAACVWFVSVSCESPECEAHSTFREHADVSAGSSQPQPRCHVQLQRERGNIPRTHLPGPGSDLSPRLNTRAGTEPSRRFDSSSTDGVHCPLQPCADLFIGRGDGREKMTPRGFASLQSPVCTGA